MTVRFEITDWMSLWILSQSICPSDELTSVLSNVSDENKRNAYLAPCSLRRLYGKKNTNIKREDYEHFLKAVQHINPLPDEPKRRYRAIYH